MKIGEKLLLIYSAIVTVFIFFGAIISGLLFAAVFLPVLIHFVLTIIFPGRKLKLLLYYDFILITIMAVMGFVAINSFPQLVSALIFLPLALYFWTLVLPKRSEKLLVFEPLQVEPAEKFDFDFDRRAFLKLIGSAGVGLFMFSIFTRRAEAAFFGSAPTQGTVTLADGYKISEIDDSSPAYYGFIDKTGKWFITKEESSGAYRYTRGDTDFSTSWPNRASLTYDYYDAIF